MRRPSVFIAALLCAVACRGEARADQGFLGNAAGYTEFILGNSTRTGDSTGQVAVGGNATFNNFSAGSGVTSGNLVGTNAVVVNGQLGGSQLNNGAAANVLYGSLQPGMNVYNNGGGSSKMGTITNDFSDASATLLADSRALAAQAGSGGVSTSSGVLNLTATLAAGTTTNTVYFNLTSAQLTGATGLNLNIADNNGTTPVVIINVNGATDTFTNSYTSTFKGVTENDILYNFSNSTNGSASQPVAITLNSNPIYGSILAPTGSIVAGGYGQINGEVIAASFSGNIETHVVDPNSGHYALFNGTPMIANAVPEPAAILSTPSGLAMAGGLAWRRRRAGRVRMA